MGFEEKDKIIKQAIFIRATTQLEVKLAYIIMHKKKMIEIKRI